MEENYLSIEENKHRRRQIKTAVQSSKYNTMPCASKIQACCNAFSQISKALVVYYSKTCIMVLVTKKSHL